ncbi:hypothetical protein NL676_008450 [Syzygium grande]|nr:hypothetical protein NL676_008450 [Syzygium grande]
MTLIDGGWWLEVIGTWSQWLAHDVESVRELAPSDLEGTLAQNLVEDPYPTECNQCTRVLKCESLLELYLTI